MSEENLFDNKDNSGVPTPTEDVNKAPEGDLFADQLSSIKNAEGKPKYDSVQKALDALNYSQEHILNLTNKSKSLEEENERLKIENAKAQSVDEVVERLAAMKDNEAPVTPQPNSINPAEINKLVQDALEGDRNNQLKQNNSNSVQTYISEKFGDKARDVVLAKANDLGTTPEKLGELSAENPQLVLALFAEGGASYSNPTSSSVSIPLSDSTPKGLDKPTKSLLQGATSKEQADYMKKIKDEVYAKHGIKT